MTLSEKLAYIAAEESEDQEALLIRAVATGVDALYRDARISAYLAGRCTREEAERDLGPELVAEVEQRRQALADDVAWGMRE